MASAAAHTMNRRPTRSCSAGTQGTWASERSRRPTFSCLDQWAGQPDGVLPETSIFAVFLATKERASVTRPIRDQPTTHLVAGAVSEVRTGPPRSRRIRAPARVSTPPSNAAADPTSRGPRRQTFSHRDRSRNRFPAAYAPVSEGIGLPGSPSRLSPVDHDAKTVIRAVQQAAIRMRRFGRSYSVGNQRLYVQPALE